MNFLPAAETSTEKVGGSRVAIVTSIAPPDYGGGGLSAYKLASRLSRSGVLSFVLTRSTAAGRNTQGYNDPQGLPQVPVERVVRVTPTRPGSSASGLGWRQLLDLVELYALAWTTTWQLIKRRREYDILHCFTANWLSFFAICVGTLLRKRTILELTLLGRDDPDAKLSGDTLGIKKLAKRIQFRLVDALVCLSPALVERCLEAGVSADKVHLVPRSVDTTRFLPGDNGELSERVARLGMAKWWPRILFVGGLIRRKGADLLIPVFSRVTSEYPNASLVIVGSLQGAELEQEIREQIRRLSRTDAVQFVERTGRIEEYMSSATVFLLPTRREGFANVIVESMASAVPVVVRLIPGITDFIIEDGKTGYLVDGDDPEAYAAAILELLRNDELRNTLGTAGREAVHTRFRTEIIDEIYYKLYYRLTKIASQSGTRSVAALRGSLR